MANKKLFKSEPTAVKNVPQTNVINNAGGTAYEMSDKHALAQLATTGCFNNTFYVSGDSQLEKVKELANKVSPEFLAKVAVYSRQKGYMKDMPAYLAAVLASKNSSLLTKVFDRVIDDGKMIRNFVQIIRSGVTGRKSLGTVPKKLINKWITKSKDETLFRASVGNDPSLADVIKLTHPSPENARRVAFYGYLLGKESTAPNEKGGPVKPLVEEIRNKAGKPTTVRRYNPDDLPAIVKQYETFKETLSGEIPDVEFRLLTSLKLTKEHWSEIAKNATWHQARMNLNTFQRHGVFDDPEMVDLIAKKLTDAEVIQKVKVFPYQLMAAYINADSTVPVKIKNALQTAMEIATKNVPQIDGNVAIAVDCSGSMSWTITGDRGTASSKMRCVDIAGLFGASVLRKNKNAEIIPFGSDVCSHDLNPHDSVMTNAGKLSAINGGGTDCSSPLRFLNKRNAKVDLVVFVSDNESWIDSGKGGNVWGVQRGTQTMVEWNKIKVRNPNAKLVCIDITPNTSMQAIDRDDILNIGGFSDSVFEVIADFAQKGLGRHWTDVIEAIKID